MGQTLSPLSLPLFSLSSLLHRPLTLFSSPFDTKNPLSTSANACQQLQQPPLGDDAQRRGMYSESPLCPTHSLLFGRRFLFPFFRAQHPLDAAPRLPSLYNLSRSVVCSVLSYINTALPPPPLLYPECEGDTMEGKTKAKGKLSFEISGASSEKSLSVKVLTPEKVIYSSITSLIL